MPDFSPTVSDFWRSQFPIGDASAGDGAFTVVINPQLSEDRQLMMLETPDGTVVAALTPELAESVGVHPGRELSEPDSGGSWPMPGSP